MSRFSFFFNLSFPLFWSTKLSNFGFIIFGINCCRRTGLSCGCCERSFVIELFSHFSGCWDLHWPRIILGVFLFKFSSFISLDISSGALFTRETVLLDIGVICLQESLCLLTEKRWIHRFNLMWADNFSIPVSIFWFNTLFFWRS